MREENRRLVARIARLRADLEAATRENAELRREAAQLRAESEQLRAGLRAPGDGARPLHAQRMERMGVMLRDQHSRNP
jgi:cell division protein FtsB